LPEDDKDWLSDLEELDEVEDNLEEEIKCLIEEAEEPVPELHRDEPGVVSPVKVTLTPAKKENAGEDEDVEEEDEEVTLVDDGEVDASRKPLLWEVELLLTEQKDEVDDEKDPEYVPPSSCLEISLDYDEYSDGEISDDEVQALKVDMQAQPPVPSDYIAVWVKVDSPSERISKAKEEHASEQEEISAKSKTSGKESGADENIGANITSTSTLESDGARKKSLSGSSNDGKLKLGLDASGEVRRNSSCSNLSAGSNSRRKSVSGKSSCSEVEAVPKPQRERKESIASQLEDGDVKKQSPVVVLGSQTTRKVSIGDGDSSSVSEVSEGVV